MKEISPDSSQNEASDFSPIANAVVGVLNQLPPAVQRQVLDFVEFLLHQHQEKSSNSALLFNNEPVPNDLEAEFDEWEAASDEDWLATETSLTVEAP